MEFCSNVMMTEDSNQSNDGNALSSQGIFRAWSCEQMEAARLDGSQQVRFRFRPKKFRMSNFCL